MSRAVSHAEQPGDGAPHEIVHFRFLADELELAPAAGNAWVSVRRVCEALGLTATTELARLRRYPWAEVTTLAVGKQRVAFVDVRTLSGWLATATGAADAEKLLVFQRTLPEAIANHLLGPRLPGGLDPLVDALAKRLEPLIATEFARASSQLVTRILQLEQHIAKAPENALGPSESWSAAAPTLAHHQAAEKQRMLVALETCNWNRAKAAEMIGMPRRTFYRRLEDYEIQTREPSNED